MSRVLPPTSGKRELFEKIEISPTSEDYKRAEQHVLSGKNSKLELVKVFKINAEQMETKFDCFHNKLKNQNRDRRKSFEKFVYHGTKEQVITKILTCGFHPNFPSTPQGQKQIKYAHGCYFAGEIAYSLDDRVSVPSQFDRLKFVFVVRLLVGSCVSVFTF